MTHFDRTTQKTARARKLRREATPAEQKLWFHLRGDQMAGFSFRRQHPAGAYVLDFYCPTAKLAVELDGEQHGMAQGLTRDRVRCEFLKNRGIRTLRFWNHELKDNLEGCVQSIYRALKETPARNAVRSDLPLSGGGKEMQ